MIEREALDELRNVAWNYPVRPVEVLSEGAIRVCALRGWVTRNTAGHWLPTRVGLARLEFVRRRHPRL